MVLEQLLNLLVLPELIIRLLHFRGRDFASESIDCANNQVVRVAFSHAYLFWLYPATWASRRSRESRPSSDQKIKSTMRPPAYRTRQDWRPRPAAEVSSYGCRAWSSPASCPDPGSKVVSQPETRTCTLVIRLIVSQPIW